MRPSERGLVMAKALRTIFVALLVVLVGSSAAWAGRMDKEVPIKGALTGTDLREVGHPDCAWLIPDDWDGPEAFPFWKFTTTGTGNVSHLGKVDFTLVNCTSPLADPMSTGTITFEAANGDELVIAHTGYFEMGESVQAFYAWDVESGTGRFDGAVGSGETHPGAHVQRNGYELRVQPQRDDRLRRLEPIPELIPRAQDLSSRV